MTSSSASACRGVPLKRISPRSTTYSRSAIADRLYVVDRGEILFSGTPRQALADEEVMRALRG